jgi:hypothetical protein
MYLSYWGTKRVDVRSGSALKLASSARIFERAVAGNARAVVSALLGDAGLVFDATRKIGPRTILLYIIEKCCNDNILVSLYCTTNTFFSTSNRKLK